MGASVAIAATTMAASGALSIFSATQKRASIRANERLARDAIERQNKDERDLAAFRAAIRTQELVRRLGTLSTIQGVSAGDSTTDVLLRRSAAQSAAVEQRLDTLSTTRRAIERSAKAELASIGARTQKRQVIVNTASQLFGSAAQAAQLGVASRSGREFQSVLDSLSSKAE